MTIKSDNSLEKAFIGEATANQKYLAFAEKADQEGFQQIACLFRAVAMAENIHAQNHLKGMNIIKSTKENLKNAIVGEKHEFEQMYPQMIKIAKEEKAKYAEISFFFANEAEKIHANLYAQFLEENSQNKKNNNENYSYFVCQKCGFITGKELIKKCPICNTTSDLFKKVD